MRRFSTHAALLGAIHTPNWLASSHDHPSPPPHLRPADTPRFYNAIRLVNGSSPAQGRPEVLRQGAWLPVCSDYFEETMAGLVCQQLGYGGSTGVLGASDAFGRSDSTSALWLYSWCTWAVGNPSLDFCPYVTWSSNSPCSAFAAVTCAYPPGAAAAGRAGWRGCGAAAGHRHRDMHVLAALDVP